MLELPLGPSRTQRLPSGARFTELTRVSGSSSAPFEVHTEVAAMALAGSACWSASCAATTVARPPSSIRMTVPARDSRNVRMRFPSLERVGSRQWLGAVPATRVWPASQRLPLTAYDGASRPKGSRRRGREGGPPSPTPDAGHRTLGCLSPRSSSDMRRGPPLAGRAPLAAEAARGGYSAGTPLGSVSSTITSHWRRRQRDSRSGRRPLCRAG